MEKLIYFIRHGQTDYNLKKIIQGSGVDSDLNATGLAQAQAFYNHYQDLNFDGVYASALKRAQQTIQSFIKKDRPPNYSSLINEINWGIHEGKSYELGLADSYKALIKDWQAGNFDARVEGGESAAELGNRCQAFLDQLTPVNAKQLLVCTHGRTLRCLMSIIKGESLAQMENYAHSNTGLFLVRQYNDGYELLKQNDIEHLEKAQING